MKKFLNIRVQAMRLGLATLLMAAAGMSIAQADDLVDCPLRDEPYSITTPLMDLMLKPEAVDVINRHMNGMLKNMPGNFMSTQAPSFSAIVTLSNVLAMGGVTTPPPQVLVDELAALEVTDADRVARCARYDIEVPQLQVPAGSPRVLLFEKMTGFRDAPSVEAATAMITGMAERNGWALVRTENGAAISPSILAMFDVVVWNNNSGDVLTLSQRRAFVDYIENGGGYVGIHGAGGDPNYIWDWYVDQLLGARFIGHPADPQFQDGSVVIEATDNAIGQSIASGWTLNDEWYSFKSSPRAGGATVIARLDESTYSPKGRGGQDLRMGDHPIAWTRCVGDGRSFYSAIGHRPEVYSDPQHVRLLEQGILWAANKGKTTCRQGQEIPFSEQE